MNYLKMSLCLAVFPSGIVGSSGDVWKENRTLALTLLRAFGMGKNEMAENIVEEVR